MYLDFLNKEEQKNFLELAKYAIGVDGKYTEEEEEIFNGYKYECRLENFKPKRQYEIEKVIKDLSLSEKKIKKIVMMELLGLFLADNDYDIKEAEFIDRLTNSFGLSEYEVGRMKRWVEAMNDLFAEGYELISK